jgi:hypothetical protein
MTTAPRPSAASGEDAEPAVEEGAASTGAARTSRRAKPLDEEKLDELAARLSELPEPVAALLVGVEVARAEGDATGVRKRLFELGIGVVRYGVSAGLALLAAHLGEKTAPRPVAEALHRAARLSDGQWCDLARTVGSALRAHGSPGLFAFASSAALAQLVSARNDFIHRGGAGDDALVRAEAVLAAANELLGHLVVVIATTDPPTHEKRRGVPVRAGVWRKTSGSPRADAPAGSVWLEAASGSYVRLDPFLPFTERRLLLLDAPHAPGKSFRWLDPESGEHRDSEELTRAIRALAGEDSNAPRELAAEPALVGHDAAKKLLTHLAQEASAGAVRVVLLTGPFGVGRTRLAKAIADASAGFGFEHVLAATCSSGRRGPLRPLARALAETSSLTRVAEAAARVSAVGEAFGRAARDALVEGVEEALLEASLATPLLLALDDVQNADDETLLLLSLLTERATARAAGKLLVVTTCRDERQENAALRRWIGQVEADVGAGASRIPLATLGEPEARKLVQNVVPVGKRIEDALVAGAGGVPFFLVQPLLVWGETGQLVWSDGRFEPANEGMLTRAAPGVRDLVRARLGSYFEPGSDAERAAEQLLAGIALRGGALELDELLLLAEAVGIALPLAENTLSTLREAGLVATRGERQEHAFAQSVVERAVLEDLREKTWFRRVFRALLGTLAARPEADLDAAFLGAGYASLRSSEEASRWYEVAVTRALSRGSFEETQRLAEAWALASPEPDTRARAKLRGIEGLLGEGRAAEAESRLEALRAEGVAVGPVALRARVLALAIGTERRTLSLDAEPTLVAELDALGEPALAREGRLVMARLRRGEAGLAELDALLRTPALGAADRYRALALRFELVVEFPATSPEERRRAASRLREAARELGSTWAELDAENSEAVAESDAGNFAEAVARFDAVAARAAARKLGTLSREATLNAATTCLRAGRAAEAAARTAALAETARGAGDVRILAQAQSVRSDACLREGQLDEALAAIDEALAIVLAGQDYTATLALLRRAEIRARRGEHDAARGDAARAQAYAEAAKNVDHAVRGALWIGLCDAATGADGAAATLRAALGYAERERTKLRAPTARLVAQARGALTPE